MRRSFASGLSLVFLVASGATATAGELDEIDRDISTMHLVEARRGLDALAPEAASSPRGRFLEGKLRFFEGDLEGSLVELRAAIEGERTALDWKILRDRVQAAQGAVGGFERTAGASGRFVFAHRGGDDRLLVPYADEALRRQLEVLERVFDDRLGFDVQVLVLPDGESMAAVSGLTTEQIEKTGTVGVSKNGKVMVLSPRALATGYPWLDTLAHELTHVFVTRASRDRAPIWLHEGVAKLLEGAWRGMDRAELTPQEAYLLDRAAREARLIPLRRFHPSVALLPSQEDAGLAYAQVLSFTTYLDERLDERAWIGEILRGVGAGEAVDSAFTRVFRFNVSRLYLWWEQTVSGKRQTPVPAVGLMKRRYQRGATGAEPIEESVLSAEVRRLLRIGDLLRLRSHTASAEAEYRKALAISDTDSPEITDRLGGVLLEQQKWSDAVSALEPVSRLYPFHAAVHVQLGFALAGLGRDEEAEDAFERAIAINPFQPKIHCALADLHARLGRSDDAALEASHCAALAASKER